MNDPGILHRKFNKPVLVGSLFALVSALTTLGVHLVVIQADNFEQNVLLYNNPTYLFSRWIVIFHCIAVFVSMTGIYLVINHRNHLGAKIGLISFAVFSWTEISRMLLALIYLNGLRERYVNEADPVVRAALRMDIENFSLAGTALFAIFIVGFAMGNLCYGLDLVRRPGLGKALGICLLIWFLTGTWGLVNVFLPSDAASGFFEVYNVTFQPVVRVLVAAWLFVVARLPVHGPQSAAG